MLDDLAARSRAHQDPALFAADFQPPLLIDEIQYAPQLLSPIKRLVDAPNTRPGSVWLTGSQSFEIMKGVPTAYFAHLAETSFPKLHGIDDPAARDLYLSSYLQTYIEDDVRELLGIQKRREFEVFLRMCALRTGQVLNLADLARDAGIAHGTARDWISLLEDSFLIRLVHPHHTNRTQRMIKSPKLYFLDVGLAAWLGGWKDSEALRLGPMGGAILETHVLGQILRHFRHRAREVDITYWRTRDGEEVDFLVENAGGVTPIEVKMGSPNGRLLPSLARMRDSRWKPGQIGRAHV